MKLPERIDLICNGSLFTQMNGDVGEKMCNGGETSQRKRKSSHDIWSERMKLIFISGK